MTVVGVGGRVQADPADLMLLVAKALAQSGRSLADVTDVVTVDARRDHPGVTGLADATRARLTSYDAATLARQDVQYPSDVVAGHTGTPSVAEAAVLAAGATPLDEPARADGWVVVVGERRPDLTHHGDVEVDRGMLDFAVNVHADRPPEFLRAALRGAIDDLARYPDVRAGTEAVAAAHGVPPGCVLLTHGAAEAFTLVARQPWRAPAVVHPQFTEPEAALLAAGHRPDRVLLRPESGFRLPADVPLDADLVVIGNPTNPTSRLHPPEALCALASTAPGTDSRLLVVDEAFMDAVEDVAEPVHSLARKAAQDKEILVIRSLTKTYSIAGLRVGYVIGHPDRIRSLEARRTPWPVSSLAAAAAIACLSPSGREYAVQLRRELSHRLDSLTRTLAVRGFEVVDDPRGPFVLARRADAAQVRERLRAQGVAVRRGDTFPGLGPDWLRFAARDSTATHTLDRALRG